MIKEFFVLFSAISFVIYSLHSVFSKRMILEFSRWGIGNLRILVASFQMLGGIGLLLGMYNIWLLCLVSFFLTLMMIIAIVFITMAYSKSKKDIADNLKHKVKSVYYLIALVLILSRIPWSVWL